MQSSLPPPPRHPYAKQQLLTTTTTTTRSPTPPPSSNSSSIGIAGNTTNVALPAASSSSSSATASSSSLLAPPPPPRHPSSSSSSFYLRNRRSKSDTNIASGLRHTLTSASVLAAGIDVASLATTEHGEETDSEDDATPSGSRAPSPSPSGRRSPSPSPSNAERSSSSSRLHKNPDFPPPPLRNFRFGRTATSSSSSPAASAKLSRPGATPAPDDTQNSLLALFRRSDGSERAYLKDPMYEERLRAALEELKALELEEFLSRASKSMDEVHFDKNVHHEGNSEHERSATVPRLADFTDDKTGRTDYIGFLQAWLTTMADTRLPRDLVSGVKPSKFSLTKTAMAIERIYVICPPILLQDLLEGKLASLYRWEDPLKTGIYALLYIALWWYDQLPAGVCVYLAYRVVRRKIWPPSLEEVQAKLAQRRARSAEAKKISDEVRHDIFASSSSSSENIGNSIASAIGVAAIMGGVPMPNNLTPGGGSPARSRAQSITGGEAPSDTHSGEHHKSKLEALLHSKASKSPRLGKRGTYRLTREIMERFGPTVQVALVDLADYLEKVKNLMLWRRPSATNLSLTILSVYALVLSIMPGYLQLKLALLWAWWQFFVIWPLQDAFPQYRRALNPFWYLLWNVPSDADSALEILKSRSAHSQTEAIKQGDIVEDSTVMEPTGSALRSRSSSSASSISYLPQRSLSRASVASLAKVEVQETSFKHFALYRGMPGALVLTSTKISFQASRGFRTLSSKIFSRKRDATALASRPQSVNLPLSNTSLSSIEHTSTDGRPAVSVISNANADVPTLVLPSAPIGPAAATLFERDLSQISYVKKETRFDIGIIDTDGLLIAFSDGSSVRLATVHRRDKAFAHLVTHSGQRIS